MLLVGSDRESHDSLLLSPAMQYELALKKFHAQINVRRYLLVVTLMTVVLLIRLLNDEREGVREAISWWSMGLEISCVVGLLVEMVLISRSVPGNAPLPEKAKSHSFLRDFSLVFFGLVIILITDLTALKSWKFEVTLKIFWLVPMFYRSILCYVQSAGSPNRGSDAYELQHSRL